MSITRTPAAHSPLDNDTTQDAQTLIAAIESRIVEYQGFLAEFEDKLFSDTGGASSATNNKLNEDLALFTERATMLVSICSISMGHVELLTQFQRNEQTKPWLALNAALVIKALCLLTNYVEYLSDSYPFIFTKVLQSADNKLLVQLFKAKQFIVTSFYNNHSRLLHADPTNENYLFKFIFREFQLAITDHPGKRLFQLEAEWRRSLKTFIEQSQSPLLVCMAIVSYHSEFSLDGSPHAKLNLTNSELLKLYNSALAKLDDNNPNFRLISLMAGLLKTRLNLDDVLGHHTKFATNRATAERFIKRADAGQPCLISGLGRDNIILALKQALTNYKDMQFTAADQKLLSSIVSRNVPAKKIQSYTQDNFQFDFAFQLLTMLSDVEYFIQELFQDYRGTFAHKAWLFSLEGITEAKLKQLIRQNDVLSMVTGREWVDFREINNGIEMLHKNTLFIRTLLRLFSSKFGYPKEDTELYDKVVASSHIAELNDIFRMVDAIANEVINERKQVGEAFMREQLAEEKNKNEYRNTVARRSFTKKKIVTNSDPQVEIVTANNAAKFFPKPNPLNKQLEQAYSLFKEQRFVDAIKVFTSAQPKNKLSQANAFAYIHATTGIADCYRALAKLTYGKEAVEYNKLAASSYQQALRYVETAMALYKREDRNRDELVVLGDFLKQDLGIDANEEKHALMQFADDAEMQRECHESCAQAMPMAQDANNLIRKKMAPDFIKDPVLLELFKLFQSNNISFYVFGGYLRDLSLGIHSRDVDISIDVTPDRLMAVFKKTNYQVKSVGSDQQHLQIELDNDLVVDLSCKPISRDDTDIKKELAACDTTITARRYYPTTGELVYLNESQLDLQNKRIRMFSGVNVRQRFHADPRLNFRYANIAARLKGQGFQIDTDILAEMPNYKTDLIHFDAKQRSQCFVIFGRSLLNGYAQATWDMLQATQLLQPRSPLYSHIISTLCEEADRSQQEGKTPSLVLLVAAMLFQSFQEGLQQLVSSKQTSMSDVDAMMENVIVHADIGLPLASITDKVKNIWSLCLQKQAEEYPQFKIKLSETLGYSDFLRANTLFTAFTGARELFKPTARSSVTP